MFCFTYASSYDCIFNELLLWSELSGEHPIFIKTVAELSGKDLPKDTVEGLMDFNRDFKEFNDKVRLTRDELSFDRFYRNDIGTEIEKLVNEFLIIDDSFINFLCKVRKYGEEDRVWQTLLEHITEEQTFMKKLFTDIKMQLN
jgi:hypothetical protein